MDKLISIITPIYKPNSSIFYLIKSLNNQSYKFFDWIIINGFPDKSLENKIERATQINIRIISEADGGFYEALNKGILSCQTPYYLVAGSDDIIDLKFVYNITELIKHHKSSFDLYSGPIILRGQRVSTRRPSLSKSSAFAAFFSNHSVGTLIKKNLHQKFGLYSSNFKIASDQLFLGLALKNGSSIHFCEFLFGTIGDEGFSRKRKVRCFLESFIINLKLGHYVLYNLLAFPFRLSRILISKIIANG
jgi:glycosyltransferase involved in cell wall biosynthesis